MSSISGIGSAIGNLFSSSTNGIAPSASTQEPSTSTINAPQGFLSDVIGLSNSFGVAGLPTGGAPGDSDALLAEIELKLQKTITTTRDNTALINGAAADIAAIAAQVNIINAAAAQITKDQTAYENDDDAEAPLKASIATDQSQQSQEQSTLDTYNGYISNAQSAQTADNNDIVKQQAIANNSTSTKTQISNANAQILLDQQDYSKQQGIINQYSGPANALSGEISALKQTISGLNNQVSGLEGDKASLTKDESTQTTVIGTADTQIQVLEADLLQKLSAYALAGRSVIDQENDRDGDSQTIDRQFDKVSEDLRNVVNLNLAIQSSDIDQRQGISKDTAVSLVTAAARLTSDLIDVVNTLTQLTPPPDPDAGSQSFATGGSRLKLAL